jgi:hypothetical protein
MRVLPLSRFIQNAAVCRHVHLTDNPHGAADLVIAHVAFCWSMEMKYYGAEEHGFIMIPPVAERLKRRHLVIPHLTNSSGLEEDLHAVYALVTVSKALDVYYGMPDLSCHRYEVLKDNPVGGRLQREACSANWGFQIHLLAAVHPKILPRVAVDRLRDAGATVRRLKLECQKEGGGDALQRLKQAVQEGPDAIIELEDTRSIICAATFDYDANGKRVLPAALAPKFEQSAQCFQ